MSIYEQIAEEPLMARILLYTMIRGLVLVGVLLLIYAIWWGIELIKGNNPW